LKVRGNSSNKETIMAQISERSRKTLGRAQYAAVSIGNVVKLYAVGFNPTPGYVNFFEEIPTLVPPPEFAFYSIRPDHPVPEVITFFVVNITFISFDPPEYVTVHDADGPHRVRVVRVGKAEGGDGPFPRFER
jgi:hypothetical protein